MEKICWQITVAAFMQPLQYDLRDPAAKDNSIAKSSRGKKQPWRSHYNAICSHWVAKHNRTTRNWVGNCSSKTGSRRQSDKNTILKHFLKGFLEGKLLAPKWRKSADKITVAAFMQPPPIRFTRIQLQKTIVLRKQPWQEATLTQPLQCDLQRPELQNTIELRAIAPRRGRSSRFEDRLCMEKHKVSCICYLSKTHFVRDFLQIYHAGTILQLQITMEDRFEEDPRRIRGGSDHTRDRLAPVAPQR